MPYISQSLLKKVLLILQPFTSMPTCVQSEDERQKIKQACETSGFAEFTDISLPHQMLCTLIISFLWGAKCQGARKIDHSNKSRSMVSFFFTLG